MSTLSAPIRAVALAALFALVGAVPACKASPRGTQSPDPAARSNPAPTPAAVTAAAAEGARDETIGDATPAAEVEPGPYAKDERFAALAAGWPERVAAAIERLQTMIAVDVRERGAPRVVLTALRDERVPFASSSEVSGGRRRPVVRVNAEPLVAGSADADRTLLRALATASVLPPVRPDAAPAWFQAFVSIVAAGDLAERLERLACDAAAGGPAPRVDASDPAAGEATGIAVALLVAQHGDVAAGRRLIVVASDGQDPGPLVARLVRDPEGQWVGAAREALVEAVAAVDTAAARAIARAKSAGTDLGRAGLEQALDGIGGIEAPRTRFEAEADALRLSAAVELGDGFGAREVLLRSPATPATLVRLSDPGAYLLLAARAEMLPGGDPAAARAQLLRFERDFPAHSMRDAAFEDLSRLAVEAPPAQQTEILDRILAARGPERIDGATATAWVGRLLADERPGAARRFLASFGARARDPDFEPLAARVAEAEDAPSQASFERNRARAEAWIADPGPETAAEVADGGAVAAGALALSPRFPTARDGRRSSAARLLVRAAGFPAAVDLLAVRWGPSSEGFAEDLEVLAGEADFPTLRGAVSRAVPSLETDARALAAWDAATFGIDPSVLTAHASLLQHLVSPDFSTRRAAFLEVSAAGLLSTSPSLLARFSKDGAAVLRREAVVQAGRIGQGGIAREGLADASWIVRQAACGAVAEARETGAVDALRAMITKPDPDRRVRLAAVHAVLTLAPGDRRVLRELVALLRTDDEVLADDVGRRLPSLGAAVAEEVAAALRAEVSKPEPQVDRGAVFRLFLAYRRTTKRDPGYDPSLPIERVREMAMALPEGRTDGTDDRR